VNENYYESIIERKSRVGVLTKVVVLGIFLFFTVFPLFWLFLSSLKDRLDIFTFPPRFFFNPTIENYRGLFVKTFLEGGAGQ